MSIEEPHRAEPEQQGDECICCGEIHREFEAEAAQVADLEPGDVCVCCDAEHDE